MKSPRSCGGGLGRGRAVLLSHHIRTSDGWEGTAARGSGALAGFVDVLVEMRRAKFARPTVRVLSGYGRFDDIPDEWRAELVSGDPPRFEYRPPRDEDDPDPDGNGALRRAILKALPKDGSALTRKEIWDRLPAELRRGEVNFKSVLLAGAGKLWFRTGNGGRDAYRYSVAAPPGNRSIVHPPGI
jgi:hypothetical protein